MKRLSVFQWLWGTCQFSAQGDFPERFLNLAARADLGLWDIRRRDGQVTACILAGRYRRLLPLARRCGVRLKSTGKHGLPFRLLPYRRRAGMPLGFLIFCGLLWFLSLFVWTIELPQLSPEVQPKLEQALLDCGLKQGVQRSRISGKLIGSELMLNVDELSWAGVSVNGSRVVVDARELEPIAPPVDISRPCNIVAKTGGVVVTITSAAGDLVAQKEQTVAAGDLLISGVSELSDGSVQLVHAMGEVTARVGHHLETEVPFAQRATERSGRVITLRRAMALGVEIPLYYGKQPKGEFEREWEQWNWQVGKVQLPLSVRTERWYELRTVNRIIDEEEALRRAKEDIDNQLAALELTEVLSRSEDIAIDDKGVRITAEISGLDSIGVEEEIFVG